MVAGLLRGIGTGGLVVLWGLVIVRRFGESAYSIEIPEIWWYGLALIGLILLASIAWRPND